MAKTYRGIKHTSMKYYELPLCLDRSATQMGLVLVALLQWNHTGDVGGRGGGYSLKTRLMSLNSWENPHFNCDLSPSPSHPLHVDQAHTCMHCYQHPSLPGVVRPPELLFIINVGLLPQASIKTSLFIVAVPIITFPSHSGIPGLMFSESVNPVVFSKMFCIFNFIMLQQNFLKFYKLVFSTLSNIFMNFKNN